MRLCGYVRKVRKMPVEGQRELLIAANVPPDMIYSDWSAAFNAVRDDTVICVAENLRVLADSRDGISEMISEVQIKGGDIAVVMPWLADPKIVPCGPGAGAQLMAEAIKAIAQDKRGLDPKRALAARMEKIRRTSRKRALRPWRDVVGCPRPEDALAHKDMAGWSRASAYRYLGRRQPPYGPLPDLPQWIED